MKISSRWMVWAGLAATAAAALFAPKGSGTNTVDVVADTRRDSRQGAREQEVRTAGHGRLDQETVFELRPRDTDDAPIGSFSSTIWPAPKPVIAPRAAPVAPPPVEAPKAPPLPFRVVGRYIANGQLTVFMQYNDRTVLATQGAVIDDQYRVDSINATSIALIYLPLNERQTLTAESANPCVVCAWYCCWRWRPLSPDALAIALIIRADS
jgi:hypothetical protein